MAYTTLALIEAELQSSALTATSLPTSDQVTVWIDEIDDIIDITTGQTFSSTVVSSEVFDYDGMGIFRFPEAPLLSVDEVLYNQEDLTATASDFVVLESGQGKNYVEYLDEGEIAFINGNNATNTLLPKSGSQRLVISYTHGQVTTPLDIQRWATLLGAQRVIQSLLNSQANTEGGEVQVGPIAVKDPSSFGITQIQSMNTEISQIRNMIGQSFRTYRLTRTYDSGRVNAATGRFGRRTQQ